MNDNATLTQEFIKINLNEVNEWLYKIVMRTASIMLTNSPEISTIEGIDDLIASYEEEIENTEKRLAETLKLKEDEAKSEEITKADKELALQNLNAYMNDKKKLIDDFNAKVEHIKGLQKNASPFLNTFLEPILVDLEEIIKST